MGEIFVLVKLFLILPCFYNNNNNNNNDDDDDDDDDGDDDDAIFLSLSFSFPSCSILNCLFSACNNECFDLVLFIIIIIIILC